MANQQNVKFNFGLLNNAQDPVDIGTQESSAMVGVSIDDLALGTLMGANQTNGVLPQNNQGLTSAILNSRQFTLSGGIPNYQYNLDPSGTTFLDVNQNFSPGTPLVPNTLLDFIADISVEELTVPGIQFRLTPGLAYGAPITIGSVVYGINLPSTTTFTHTVTQNGTVIGPGAPVATNPGTWITLDYNIQVMFPTSGWTPAIGNTAQATTTHNPLADGEHSYILVSVQNNGKTPAEDIQSLPTESVSVLLANFAPDGTRVVSLGTKIFMPSLGTSATATWVFRKDPDSDDYIRIAIHDGTI